MQVLLYLLRTVPRVEMSLLEGASPPLRPRRLPRPGAVLLVGATLDLTPADTGAREKFELELRAEIEQSYAEQDIVPVEYDLQII